MERDDTTSAGGECPEFQRGQEVISLQVGVVARGAVCGRTGHLPRALNDA